MTVMSPDLFKTHLTTPRVTKIFHLLDRDVEVQTSLKIVNAMAGK